MIAIIKWTLWQRRWSTLWWSVGVAGVIFLSMIFYPSFRDQAAELQKSFESLPDAAVQLFGGSTDFFSPVGFMNSQVFFLTLPLVLGILAIGLGSSILAREEQDGTIESLLARPISRSHLLYAKLVAAAIVLGIVAAVGLVTTIITAAIINLPLSSAALAATFLLCFLMCLTFTAIAFVITATGKARVAALGITTLFGFGGYIVSSLAGTVDWLSGPSKVFAFHYYQPEAVLRGQYDWQNALYFVIVTAACAFVSWTVFRRRDIG